MAAPTPTTRGTPAGIRVPDGWVSKISFASNLTVGFWEIGVQPAAVDGGEPIKIDTMHNVARKMKAPPGLIEDGDLDLEVAYDPSSISNVLGTSIEALINVNQSISQLWPDGTKKTFYGWLRSFKPQKLEAGKFPTAQIVIVQSNYDPVNHTEVAPVWSNVTGT